MHHITMYLDFVSPYAWLAFEQLPKHLQGLSYQVQYRPVLLGALLQRHGNPGPAGIPAKRAWTYRHVQWLGQHLGVPLHMPAQHPFNPLPLLRLALRTSHDGSINRYVAETVFRHVWQDGADALDPQRLEQLHKLLAPQLRADAETAKTLLRSNSEAAQQAQVFGVPAFEVQGRLFWGMDSLPMLRDALENQAWFSSGAWENAETISSGLS